MVIGMLCFGFFMVFEFVYVDLSLRNVYSVIVIELLMVVLNGMLCGFYVVF